MVSIPSVEDDELSIEMLREDGLASSSIPMRGASAAGVIVEVAAYRIDLAADKLQTVLSRLEEEFVTEEWQLQHLQTADWRILGAPVGLVASIRACLQENACSITSRNTIITTTFHDAVSLSAEEESPTLERGANRRTNSTSLPLSAAWSLHQTEESEADTRPVLLQPRRLDEGTDLAVFKQKKSRENSDIPYNQINFDQSHWKVELNPPPIPQRRASTGPTKQNLQEEKAIEIKPTAPQPDVQSELEDGGGNAEDGSDSKIYDKRQNGEIPIAIARSAMYEVDLASPRSVLETQSSFSNQHKKKSIFGKVKKILTGGKPVSIDHAATIGVRSSSKSPRRKRPSKERKRRSAIEPPQLPIRLESHESNGAESTEYEQ